MFPAYYIFNILLSILLVLHVIWTYYILKIVYKALSSGKVSAIKLLHSFLLGTHNNLQSSFLWLLKNQYL